MTPINFPLPSLSGDAGEAQQPHRVVLDTQIVLDWLVFDDPSTLPLATSVEAGDLVWISEAGALAELRYVLGRQALARYRPDRDRVEQALNSYCLVLPTPATSLHGLICRDPDDQRFIDLALAAQATWLFSRDRAVLALAKRARLRGLTIIRPMLWFPPAPAP